MIDGPQKLAENWKKITPTTFIVHSRHQKGLQAKRLREARQKMVGREHI